MDIVKGALVASGMYELRPVSLSVRSSYVNFTPQVLKALSPQRHLGSLTAPVVVAYGTLETPEFQRQNREFAAAAKAAGKAADLIVLERIQPFRGGGESWQSVWAARSSGVAADAAVFNLGEPPNMACSRQRTKIVGATADVRR